MIHRLCARAVALAALAFVISGSASGRVSEEPMRNAPLNPVPAFGRTSLFFEPNRGQTDPSVSFFARGLGYRLFLTPASVVIDLNGIAGGGDDRGPAIESVPLRISFLGADAAAAASGEARIPGISNYLFGSASPSITGVEHYARVRYGSVYPGIDVLFYGDQGRLEYDFIVAPDADPRDIRISVEGADRVLIGADGDLLLTMALGNITQHRPLVYQEHEGLRRTIQARYAQNEDGSIGIRVAAYDRSAALIIDPVLSYSTFIGGSLGDYGSAIAVDSDAYAYITGYTASTNFPTFNAYGAKLGRGAINAFVTKLKPDGSGLVYSTYLGGASESDIATGIAIDSNGNAYVTGTTSGSGFPTTTGAYQKGATGGGSFVAKLGSAGNALLYSTYVLKASANGIAVDGAGNAYVTGTATSGFATTPGAFQPVIGNANGSNAFILKLNATGSAATYATFLGGSGPDIARGIAVDASGNAYVGGSTGSSNFPVANAFQASAPALQNGFVSKLNASGSGLVYSTYLGGEGTDSVNAIAIDSAGSAYVTGATYSRRFPVTEFSFQSLQTGTLVLGTRQGTAFVTKFSPSGAGIEYSSYLGGSICGSSFCTINQTETPGDAAYGIAVDSQGHAYVTGIARSPNFPAVDAITDTFQALSGNDALFVSKVSQAGNSLLYSTFVRWGAATNGSTPAGLPFDAGKGIAVDANGTAYGVAEGSTGFPTTAGAFQTVGSGASDAVAYKLSNGNGPSLTLAVIPSAPLPHQLVQMTATVPGAGSAGSVNFTWYDSGANRTSSAPLINGVASLTTSFSEGISLLGATYRSGNSNVADSPPLLLQIAPSGVCN